MMKRSSGISLILQALFDVSFHGTGSVLVHKPLPVVEQLHFCLLD